MNNSNQNPREGQPLARPHQTALPPTLKPSAEDSFAINAALSERLAAHHSALQVAEENFKTLATQRTENLEHAARYANLCFIEPVSAALKKIVDGHVAHANACVRQAENAVAKQGAEFAMKFDNVIAEEARSRRNYRMTIGFLTAVIVALIAFDVFSYRRTEPSRMLDTVLTEINHRKSLGQQKANP